MTTFVVALVLFLPCAVDVRLSARDLALRALAVAAVWVAVWSGSTTPAFAACAAALALEAAGAASLTGRVALGAAAAAAGVAAVAPPGVAFAASIVAIAINAGAAPLHVGVAALAEREPGRPVALGAISIGLVAAHLTLADSTAAHDAAGPLVLWGACASLAGALTGLVQRRLVGLWTSALTMHAGMLIAAVGAAGRGHTAAVTLLAVSMALALGGLGSLVAALEARVGSVSLRGGGGRVRSFPLLAGAFAFFAAAGVALPGTAGFIADDLLLHALWAESPFSCAVVIAASATLAIALFRGFAAVFLGAEPSPSIADDLRPLERTVAAAAMATLVALGLAPMWIVAGA